MKRAKKHKLERVPKPRNPAATAPLLAKGGPHQKSGGAKRRQAKMALARSLRGPESDE
jgi:hypothetical protein